MPERGVCWREVHSRKRKSKISLDQVGQSWASDELRWMPNNFMKGEEANHRLILNGEITDWPETAISDE